MKALCLLATASLLLPATLAAQATAPAAPSGATAPAAPAATQKVTVTGARVVDRLGGTAKVASVDAAKREITLALDNGDSFSFIAGPDMIHFDKIKAGDRLDIEVSEELSFFVTTVPGEPERVDRVDAVRAPMGDKPGAFIERRVVGSAVIEAIDYQKRTATLRGPRRTVAIEVSPETKNLEQARVGDRVVIEFIQSIIVTMR